MQAAHSSGWLRRRASPEPCTVRRIHCGDLTLGSKSRCTSRLAGELLAATAPNSASRQSQSVCQAWQPPTNSMSRVRTLLKSTYFRIALFLFLVLLLAVHPTSKWYYATDNHDIIPSDANFSNRKILLGSTLFTNLQHAESEEAQEKATEALCAAHYFPPWNRAGRKVYDLVMISNELDWLEVRLHTLSPYVDYFVVVEAATTFTGLKKELVLKDNWDRFKEFHHKIIYKIVEDTLEFKPGSQWDHEVFLRNSMLKSVFPGLIGTEKEAKKGDVIIVSDLDEIIRPETALLLRYCDYPARLRLRSRFFYYAYQWAHRNGDWDHPQATTYGGTVEKTLEPEALRKELWDSRWRWWSWAQTEASRLKIIGSETAQIHDAGWHCSSCFKTIEQVIDKLNGFSHIEFNSAENRNPATIIDRYQHGLDLFGRPESVFAFDKVSVDDVPEYIMQQHNATGRFGYLLDRSTQYAEFEDAEAMLKNPPP